MPVCPGCPRPTSVLCPGGKYNNLNLNGCLDCDSDVDSNDGATECTLCTKGNYWDWDSNACQECTEGMVCKKGSTIKNLGIKEGYWRVSDESTEVWSCPNGDGACVGGSNATNSSTHPYCEANARGPFCDICTVAMFRAERGERCQHCPRNARDAVAVPVRVWIIFGGLLFIGLVALGVTLKPMLRMSQFIIRHWRRTKKLKTKMKIILLFLQITGQV